MVDLWIDEKKQRIEDDKNWAEIKVKQDMNTGEDYIDVLIGTKNNSKDHLHIGWNLDQSIRFAEFRDITKSIGRKVESKNLGILQDGVVEINPDVKPSKTITFQFNIEGSTGEISIKQFKFD